MTKKGKVLSHIEGVGKDSSKRGRGRRCLFFPEQNGQPGEHVAAKERGNRRRRRGDSPEGGKGRQCFPHKGWEKRLAVSGKRGGRRTLSIKVTQSKKEEGGDLSQKKRKGDHHLGPYEKGGLRILVILKKNPKGRSDRKRGEGWGPPFFVEGKKPTHLLQT